MSEIKLTTEQAKRYEQIQHELKAANLGQTGIIMDPYDDHGEPFIAIDGGYSAAHLRALADLLDEIA